LWQVQIKRNTFILISTLLTLLTVTIHSSEALSRDTSFSSDGRVTTSFSAADDVGSGIAVQSDDKIVLVGTSDSGSGVLEFAVARYLPDLLSSFNGGGGGSSGGNSSGGCFITTTAYGSPKLGFVTTMAIMLLSVFGFIGFVWPRRKYNK
jgi:hypothetical protein